MKTLIKTGILLLLVNVKFVKAQSITLSPTDLSKSQTAASNDDINLSRFGKFPSIIGRFAKGTSSLPLAVEEHDKLFELSGQGYNGVNFSNSSKSSIFFTATENWTATSQGSAINFRTTANGSQFTGNRMTINHDGNIGISTTLPNSKLHVFAGFSGVTPNSSPAVFIEDERNTYINLAAPNANETGVLFGRPDDTGTSGGIIYRANKDMHLRTNGNTTRMTVSSTGNVGIGTTIPAAKLDINGDVVIKKKTLLPATTQTVNNFDRNGASVICTGAAAASAQTITLTGIAGGVDGLMLWIYPTQNFTIRLENEDIGSLEINRIRPTIGSGNILTSRGGATLIYDGNEQRWHVIDAN